VNNLSFFKKSQKDINTKSAKISVKFHSRQPSLDQETNSMLISPANEKLEFGIHYSYGPQKKDQPTNNRDTESIEMNGEKRRISIFNLAND
jgi:hypothetical protein